MLALSGRGRLVMQFAQREWPQTTETMGILDKWSNFLRHDGHSPARAVLDMLMWGMGGKGESGVAEEQGQVELVDG